ncbi:MAG: hypothetical protein VX938_03545, partial [Myxococcota bacterium]|nr:hypothetical protein [Myxococcota bacterium]
MLSRVRAHFLGGRGGFSPRGGSLTGLGGLPLSDLEEGFAIQGRLQKTSSFFNGTRSSPKIRFNQALQHVSKRARGEGAIQHEPLASPTRYAWKIIDGCTRNGGAQAQSEGIEVASGARLSAGGLRWRAGTRPGSPRDCIETGKSDEVKLRRSIHDKVARVNITVEHRGALGMKILQDVQAGLKVLERLVRGEWSTLINVSAEGSTLDPLA